MQGDVIKLLEFLTLGQVAVIVSRNPKDVLLRSLDLPTPMSVGRKSTELNK